jgi:hypothetical protein
MFLFLAAEQQAVEHDPNDGMILRISCAEFPLSTMP